MKASIGMVVSVVVLMLGAGAPAAAEQEQQQQEQQQQSGQQPPSTAFGAQPAANEQADLRKIFQTRNPEQRLKLTDDFLAKYPQSMFLGQVYAAAADAHRMRNDYAKAVEYGERAIEASPRDAFSMILVADSLTMAAEPAQPDFQEQLAKAEKYAKRAVEILPELFASIPRRPGVPEEEYNKQKQRVEGQAHAVLGLVHLRRSEYALAEEELKQAVQLRPDARDFHRLGVAHLRQEEYGEAESALQQCVELGGPVRKNCQEQLEQVRRAMQGEETPEPQRRQE